MLPARAAAFPILPHTLLEFDNIISEFDGLLAKAQDAQTRLASASGVRGPDGQLHRPWCPSYDIPEDRDSLPSLPSLTDAQDAANSHAQRNLARVQHIVDWNEWFTQQQLFGSERDAVRSVAVGQEFAELPFTALPKHLPIQSPSMLVMFQRRLGVEVTTLRSAVGEHRTLRGNTRVDAYGDAAASISFEHSRRHDAVVRAWGGAYRAASKHIVVCEHERHHAYSAKRPDISVFNGKADGRHLLLDAKARSPLTADGHSKSTLGLSVSFGGTKDEIAKEISDDYRSATGRGHSVLGLSHCVLGGGLDATAAAELKRLHSEFKGGLNDIYDAPWTASSFLKLHAQRITTALQLEVARQIIAAGAGAFTYGADRIT